MDRAVTWLLSRTNLAGFSAAGVALVIAVAMACLLIAVRLFRRSTSRPAEHTSPMTSSDPVGLEHYFTDVEHLREHFATLLTVPVLAKRLLVIYGMSGIGKSSLLQMFRLYSRKAGTPIGLASGDEVNSPADILYSWQRDLDRQVAFPSFTRELAQYRDVLHRVESHAAQEHEGTKHAGISKAVLRGVMQGVGSAAGMIPIVGIPISILLGGASDSLVDWLHGFLSKPQIALLLDPTEQLTERFLADLASATASRGTPQAGRIVLLLDTYEKLRTLDQWLADLARRLPPAILLVVAGQTVPASWAKQWPDWMAHATIEEIQPMTEDTMSELVRRYYAAQRGGEPPSAQVNAIIRFARGLPIAVTAVVQLWIQYGVEDFQAVKPQVVADLVDRLTDGIPEQVRPALKAAATLRWFNLELLQIVSVAESVSDTIYSELRRFPFVRPHGHGHAFHDSVREHLDDNLRLEEPARHHELHMRAAAHFHEQATHGGGDTAIESVFEALYHDIMANEVDGMRRLRDSAEELVRLQLVSQFRALVTDLANYPLQRIEHQLWRDYYRGRLFDLEGHRAEAMSLYQSVADSAQAPERLRAYALVDWAWITRQDHTQMESVLQRFRSLFPDPDALVEPDSKLGFALFELAELHWGEWDEMLGYLERARSFYHTIGDTYWVPFAYNRLKYHYLDRGIWQPALAMQRQGLAELDKLASERERTYLRAEFLGGVSIGWIWAGQYHETEKMLREALALAERFQRVQQEMYFRRDLGLVLGLQGRLEEAQQQFARGFEIGPLLDPAYQEQTLDSQAIVVLRCRGPEAAAPLFASCRDLHQLESGPNRAISSFLVWCGALYEQRGEFDLAEQCYRECRARHEQQLHWQAGALMGLVRVQQARGDFAALAAALDEASELLDQHAYPQYLAALRLSQAHLAWDVRLPGGEQAPDTALHLYQEALIFALHYNRFLLDDLLAGPPDATPLRSIIPHCLARGGDGQRILAALAEWWSTALLPSLTPEPDTIVPIPAGVSLLDCEREARAREPGNGQIQHVVVAQLQQALDATRT